MLQKSTKLVMSVTRAVSCHFYVKNNQNDHSNIAQLQLANTECMHASLECMKKDCFFSNI